jgi:hypothetical protein
MSAGDKTSVSSAKQTVLHWSASVEAKKAAFTKAQAPLERVWGTESIAILAPSLASSKILVRASALFKPVKMAVFSFRFMGWFLVGLSRAAATRREVNPTLMPVSSHLLCAGGLSCVARATTVESTHDGKKLSHMAD